LISPRHVLTAGHCVSDGDGSFYKEWFCYPAFNAGLGTEDGWIPHHHVWVTDRWHKGMEWGYDLAVITLDVANTGRGWFAFGFDDSVDSNTWFDVDGYPGDKVDAAGERILVSQSMQMDYSVSTNLYETETGDIVGGNSGGPGWISTAKNDSMVNAVVSFACCGPAPYDDFNGLVRITEEKYDAICDYIQSFDETKSHCTPQSVKKTVTTTHSTTTTTSTSTTVTTIGK
jgi:V8-like Glu-specific endopeptidase